MRIAGVREGEFVAQAGDAIKRVMVEMLDLIGRPLARSEPQLVGMEPQHVAADLAEAVDVSFAGRTPVDELDPELEGGLALADHLQWIDPGQREEVADVRDGRLADADDPDLIRFNELDLDLAQPLRKDGSGHPAGGAAADDCHLTDRLFGTGQYFSPRDRARARAYSNGAAVRQERFWRRGRRVQRLNISIPS